MTQAPVDRLDRLEAMVEAGFEKIERKLDAIATDVVELKISQAKTEERFNSIDQRFEAIDQRFDEIDKRFDATDTRFKEMNGRIDRVEVRFQGQDNRLFGLVVSVALALIGLLTKIAFFPGGTV